jgi:hypothetical protein
MQKVDAADIENWMLETMHQNSAIQATLSSIPTHLTPKCLINPKNKAFRDFKLSQHKV